MEQSALKSYFVNRHMFGRNAAHLIVQEEPQISFMQAFFEDLVQNIFGRHEIFEHFNLLDCFLLKVYYSHSLSIRNFLWDHADHVS